jgi:hypothetical protein
VLLQFKGGETEALARLNHYEKNLSVYKGMVGEIILQNSLVSSHF